VSDFETGEDKDGRIILKEGQKTNAAALGKVLKAINQEVNSYIRSNEQVIDDYSDGISFFKWALEAGHIKICTTGKTAEDIHKLYTEQD
jgi:hypothetical protein